MNEPAGAIGAMQRTAMRYPWSQKHRPGQRTMSLGSTCTGWAPQGSCQIALFIIKALPRLLGVNLASSTCPLNLFATIFLRKPHISSHLFSPLWVRPLRVSPFSCSPPFPVAWTTNPLNVLKVIAPGHLCMSSYHFKCHSLISPLSEITYTFYPMCSFLIITFASPQYILPFLATSSPTFYSTWDSKPKLLSCKNFPSTKMTLWSHKNPLSSLQFFCLPNIDLIC